MKGMFLVLALGAMGTTLGACAAGAEVSDTAPPTPPAKKTPQAKTPELDTVGDYCKARARAECSEAVVTGCGVASQSACESAQTKSCMNAIPQGTKFVAKQAPTCIAAVSTAYSTATITADGIASVGEACGPKLFAGPGAARAPCETDYDCDSEKDLSCVIPFPPPESGMGQCFVPTVVGPGDDCSGQSDVCGTGTYCNPQGQTCTTDAQADDPCSPGYNVCAAGLTCNGAGPFATCSAGGGADGSACNAATDCTSNLCDKSSGQSDGTCASTITLSSVDSMCQAFQ